MRKKKFELSKAQKRECIRARERYDHFMKKALAYKTKWIETKKDMDESKKHIRSIYGVNILTDLVPVSREGNHATFMFAQDVKQ